MFRHNRRRGSAPGAGQNPPPQPVQPVPKNLDEAVALLHARLGGGADIVVRSVRYGSGGRFGVALIYIDGMVDTGAVDLAVLQPLLDAQAEQPYDMQTFAARFVSVASVELQDDVDLLVRDVLSGHTVLLGEGCTQALSIGARRWAQRALEEPATETVVRGPRQGFTETLRTNVVLLRRIVQNPNLRVDMLKLGANTGTSVAVLYVNGIVLPGLVDEVKARLNAVKTKKVLESGNLQVEIADSPNSIFETIGSSERPDTVAFQLLNGRVAIVVDGSPFVLSAPYLFLESFRSPEDFYIKRYFALMLFIVRLISYVLTMLAPAIYVALTTFHQELIPTSLLFTMTSGRQGTPFPSSIEALLMIALFDILKEAGVRLPKPIGSAISIVGALVLGQSAVQAGLVGPFMIIVVATTAIAGFAIPAQLYTTAILRYVFLAAASLMGGFGIMMGILVLLLHLVSLESFRVPFLAPLSPLNLQWLENFAFILPQDQRKNTNLTAMQALRNGQDSSGGDP